MDRPLTGWDAVDAVGTLMRLGNAGARFDGARVRAAVRHAWGRASLRAALRRPSAHARPHAARAARTAPRHRPGRSARHTRPRRVETPSGRPGREA